MKRGFTTVLVFLFFAFGCGLRFNVDAERKNEKGASTLHNNREVFQASLKPSPIPVLGLEDDTATVGLSGITYQLSTYGDGTYGAAFGDVNQDGFLDLVVHEAGLYINNNGESFTHDPSLIVGWRSTAFHDYDNDGDLDFFGGRSGIGSFFIGKNNINLSFTNLDWATDWTGISQWFNIGNPAFIDYNEDGKLDIFAPEGEPASSGGNNFFIKNLGGDAFSMESSPFLNGPARNGETVATADYNSDGHTDILYRSSDTLNGYLYRANGDGTFTDVHAEAGVFGFGTYVGSAFGDYDNDGDLDLFLGRKDKTSKMYKNNGDGTFTNVSSETGVFGSEYSAQGAVFGDIDNDGDLDLLVPRLEGTSLYKNNGDGTFTDIASLFVGMSDPGGGAMLADIDNDGDLDFFISGNPSRFYRNSFNSSHFLKVKVHGNGSNSPRDGTGAQVELYDSTGTNFLAMNEIFSSVGMGSQGPKYIHFGLAESWGGDEATYVVKVRFTGGDVKTVSNVKPKSFSHTVGTTVISQMIVIEQDP